MGGGSKGPSAVVTDGDSEELAHPGELMSGSDSSASSSHESATTGAFFLAVAALAVAVFTAGRAMSYTGLLLLRERSRRDDWSSVVVASEIDIKGGLSVRLDSIIDR